MRRAHAGALAPARTRRSRRSGSASRSICSCTSRGRWSQTSSAAIRRVQQEDARPAPRVLEHVDLVQELELMAGDEAGAIDQVGRADRTRARAQVRDRDRAGLLRVVDEVALHVEVGLLADDLDRVLVGADRAVGAEAVEHRRRRRRPARCRTTRSHGERRVRHVVDDADGEVVLRRVLRELVEDRLHHRRRELLRRQPVAAADDARLRCERRRAFGARFGERGDHVQVERIAERARLLRAVQHGDACGRSRQRREERARRERAVQPHLQHADLLAARRRDSRPSRARSRRPIP